MQDKLKKLDYENSLGLVIRNASKTLEKALDVELLRNYGLSGGQWRVIGAIAVKSGISQKEVAELISLDSSTLVPIIDRLEHNGLVRRETNPNDRRNNRIFLTEKSESILDSIVTAVLNLRKSVYKDISAGDIEITKSVLKKIIANSELFISEKPLNTKSKQRRQNDNV